jgi:hypothetical protein
MDRMAAAADQANLNVLIHAADARAAVHSVGYIATSVDDFYNLLGSEIEGSRIHPIRWRDALRDPQQRKIAAREVGPKVGLAAVASGVGLLGLNPSTRQFGKDVITSTYNALR